MINDFSGKHSFLSNFYSSPIQEGILTYPTVEHYYQSKKATNMEDKLMVAKAVTPAEAKHMGRQIKMREDWEDIKIGVMERGLRMKFAIPELRDLLLATGDEELVEGNWWNDTCWGVCRGVGENNLGKLLMKIRAELREQ